MQRKKKVGMIGEFCNEQISNNSCSSRAAKNWIMSSLLNSNC